MEAIQANIDLYDQFDIAIYDLTDSVDLLTTAIYNLQQTMITSGVGTAPSNMLQPLATNFMKYTIPKIPNVLIDIPNYLFGGMKKNDQSFTTQIPIMAHLVNTIDPASISIAVDADTTQLEAAYNQIKSKVDEIKANGIYGSELFAGADTLSSYTSDLNVITTMMDTLSNYAMGMSGGGVLDSKQMSNYAAQLGQALNGDYDALAKKGFELSDAQKQIMANGTQMQRALVIDEVISVSWDNLYTNMSNTPQAKVIELNQAWGALGAIIGQGVYPFIMLVMYAALLFAQVIKDNWSWIGPLIYGIATALAFYLMVLGIVNGALAVYNFFKGVMAARTAFNTSLTFMQAVATANAAISTTAAATAQAGFNAALMACPLVRIIMLIILVIAVIYGIVAAINHFAGTSISVLGSALGFIAGVIAAIINTIAAVIKFLVDILSVVWNFIAVFVNFLANVFKDPIGAVINLFFNLADVVLSILQTVAGAIDTIFGTDFTGVIQGWRDSLSGWVDETFGDEPEVMATLNTQGSNGERLEYGDAWDAGQELGKGIEDGISSGVSDMFDVDPTDMFEGLLGGDGQDPMEAYKDLIGGDGQDPMEAYKDLLEGNGEDPMAAYQDILGGDSSQGFGGMGGYAPTISDNVSGIADNTSNMNDNMEVSEEDLKYLRDTAEQEAINRFTTAEIKIEQNNTNNLKSDMDLDGVVNLLSQGLEEGIAVASEGVHY